MANNLPMTIPQLMRQAGYVYLPGRGGDDSYIRVMGRSPYPRFHVYIQERDNQLIINLHLDQKQPGYGVSARHNGEYEGPVVETEARRLIQLISHA
jgi:hypothetical protein